MLAIGHRKAIQDILPGNQGIKDSCDSLLNYSDDAPASGLGALHEIVDGRTWGLHAFELVRC